MPNCCLSMKSRFMKFQKWKINVYLLLFPVAGNEVLFVKLVKLTVFYNNYLFVIIKWYEFLFNIFFSGYEKYFWVFLWK